MFCCILLIDPTKTILKDNERTSMNKRNTLLYKNLSFSFYSRKGHRDVISLRDRWREIYSGRGLLYCLISSSWSQGVSILAPPCKPYRQRRPNVSDRLRVPGSTPDSDWTHCLILTAWFSIHVVAFRLHIARLACPDALPGNTAIPLFTNHNVTACQSTWGHQERT